jgi:D-glycero-alpha-D-manno-heptose 1-phosphate guanylyltransferase
MIQDTRAILLVGGLGTRLRSVLPATPKALASVGSKSFLDLLVRQLRHQGIRHMVMCTGHLAEQIENEFGDGRAWDVVIEYSRETEALGTAGAIKRAEHCLHGINDFLVMNGDSFLEVDFHDFVRFHRGHGGLVSIAGWRARNAARYGTVRMEASGRVTAFEEKTGNNSPGLINGGVYVFGRAVLEYIPETPASLERDVFPHLLDRGVFALEQHGMFIDIGTPEDLAHAQPLCDRLNEAALRGRHSGAGQHENMLLRGKGSRGSE